MTSVPVERKIGRYEVVREVGRGATSIVYLARQTDLDRDVALKELASFHTADAAFIERFLRESRLAGSLNHPNIVTVYEYFEHEGTPFIAMEYLERGSLRPLLHTLGLQQITGALEGLLAGLAHAHERGTVHRDLKPENVLVAANGTVKIADFGIAKAFDAEGAGNPLTLTGTTVGTPAYMAPEQAMATEVGPAADLYAVGVMAYEMFTGELPFHASDVPMAIMLQHLHDPVPSLGAARPDLDLELCQWVERMLAKEPSSRPESATDAWDELDEIAIGALGPRWRRQSRLTVSAGGPRAIAQPERTATTERLAPTSRLVRRPRRAFLIALACALVLVLLGGGVAAALALSEDTPQSTVPQRSTGVETPPPETARRQPAPRTTLAAVDLDTRGDRAIATLRLTGPPLDASMIDVRDDDLTDGHAWFELEADEIGAQTSGAANDALSVRVRKGKNLLRVDVRVEADVFDKLRVSRASSRSVVAASRRSVPRTGSQSSPPGTVTVTDATDTTPTTPTKPEKPRFGTR